MRIDFNMFEDLFEVVFEIYIEDKLVQKQTAQAPEEMLIINFLQTAEQIGRDQRPMKIKMIRPDVIWDNFEKREKVLNNEVAFSNNAMIEWEENNKKGET